MKRLFRQTIGLIVVWPAVMLVYLCSLFIGKERAIRFLGPHVTYFAKSSLRYWIPEIKNASEFDLFTSKMKKNFRRWMPFYDISIVVDNNNVFKLHISNCPFCEMIIKLGLPELAPYVCQGDWEKAKENRDKWDFKRSHQIGTGDSFCDHTYLRKQTKPESLKTGICVPIE